MPPRDRIPIRRYQPGEEAAVWSVYFEATRQTVAREYTPAQVRRWAPDEPDRAAWAERLARTNPFVAIVESRIVGFAELEADGHIAYFYVHPDFLRQGIGAALLKALEDEARQQGIDRLFAEVSTTGAPFFLAQDFVIVEERANIVCGAPAQQFVMYKMLR